MGCNIELEGITSAIKARDLLKNNNFKVRIEKNVTASKKGCSYSVVTSKDCDSAVRLLNGKVKIVGIS